jgi:hypothetical protein
MLLQGVSQGVAEAVAETTPRAVESSDAEVDLQSVEGEPAFGRVE